MENNIININNSTRRVRLSKDFIGVSGENEYEKLIFNLDQFIDGNGLIEIDFGYIHHYEYILSGNETGTYEIKGYTFTMPTISANDKLYFYEEEPVLQLVHNSTTSEITLTAGTSQNKLTMIPKQKVFFNLTKVNQTYTFDIKSSLLRRAGTIEMEIRISDLNSIVFKSEKFNIEVKEAINATSTIPDQYKDWIDRAEEKIREMENLNVEGERVSDGVEITFTDKQGVEKIEKVNDGATGPQGPKGDTGNSGVYVGPTQPTDPNVNVWINTNATAEEYYTKTEADTMLALKQNITDNTLTTTNKTVPTAINEVNSIAKGANQAIGYANYSTMITALNSLASTTYRLGQNIYIVTTNVPDLWVSSVESTSSTYTYTTDAQVVSDLETNGYIQCGYYRLSMLETQKVDLTNYVKDTDYATASKAGITRTDPCWGIQTSSGYLIGFPRTYNQYQSDANQVIICKGTLENVLTARIGSIDSVLDSINGGVI